MEKYIVITGASAGIGYELAKKYAETGFNLIVCARRIEVLEQLKASYPAVDIQTFKADLAQIDQVLKFYEFTKQFDVCHFVNNAGFGDMAITADAELDKLIKMVDLNVKALTVLSTLFVKDYQMKAVTLTNISSVAGYTISLPAVTYSATKFYVSAFTEGLAAQLVDKPMKIKLICPAATETEFGKVASDSEVFDYKARLAKFHTAKEIAQFIYEHEQASEVIGIVDVTTYQMEQKDAIFKTKIAETAK
ncbi:MAG: SDR family NAD(P)-dependent oxidoreductase [Mycoplasmatales bacterium]